MATHTVYRLTSQPGRDGIENLQATTEPVPTVAKHEVLVRVRSVALNYRDIAIASSSYPLPVKDGVVPCSDMAGEIIEIGSLVEDLSIGDAVITPVSLGFQYGIATYKTHERTLGALTDGVLAEYIAVPAASAIKLPKSSHTFNQWASMVTTGSTAWNALYGCFPLKPGQTVLLQGTGGVSLTAAIIAKAAGATIILTSSSDEKLAFAQKEYGVDYTINYKKHPDWSTEVQRITGGRGADHVLDVGGAGTIEQSLKSVARGGVVSLIGFLSGLPKDRMPDVALLTLLGGATVRGVLAGSKQQLEEAVQLIAAKGLPAPVDKVYGFSREEVVSAWKHVASGAQIGKVCISLD